MRVLWKQHKDAGTDTPFPRAPAQGFGRTRAEKGSRSHVEFRQSTLASHILVLWMMVGTLYACSDNGDGAHHTQARWIDRATLEDKVRGSWVGQMAGVAWGAPTEFLYLGRIIPEGEVPVWQREWINLAFIQDDIYVEIPFLDSMRKQGVNAGWDVFGDAFRDTRFPLWHANKAGRDNLRSGIQVPDSGHYSCNLHCDDIDWQIEADFVGSMCPGLVNEAVEIAWRVGHVMNYGDGVLGGVFLAAMHAASFFADSVNDIIEAGRAALPEGSRYRLVVDDVIGWHGQGLTWEETWQLLQNKWGTDDRCPDFDSGLQGSKNIDAKLNGAYVLTGLLYGNGDLEQSMRIAMRCGQDSDCNPSSVGGILGNWMGLSGIPEPFKKELQSCFRFLFTEYTLDDALVANLELAGQVMLMAGAAVEEGDGSEVWTVPVERGVQPPLLEQWATSPNTPPQLTAHVVSQNGMAIELEASATDEDGVLGYEWHFGDVSRAWGAHAVHHYTAPGTYEIIIYATDKTGNTSWQSIPVTVP